MNKKDLNKKGLTLIETLAVIIILGILALIITPGILDIIKASRKKAFIETVNGVIASSEYYVSDYLMTNSTDPSYPIIITCNGTTCEAEDGTLITFKGPVPISGRVILVSPGVSVAEVISNGMWCGSGEKGKVEVQENCALLDHTSPIINDDKLNDIIIVTTTNTLVLSMPMDLMYDDETGISEYNVDLYLDNNIVDSKQYNDPNIVFTNLNNNTEYKVVIAGTNGNGSKTSVDKTATTLDIVKPTITYTNDPTVAANGYFKSQTLNVTYNIDNIEVPTYYIRSGRNALTNIDVIASCGSEVEPFDCTSTTGTSIEANMWYQISGNINVIYNEDADVESYLTALIYDGTNYDGADTKTVAKIEKTNPTPPTITGGNTNWTTTSRTISITEEGTAASGVAKYQYYVSTSSTSQSGGSWHDASGTSQVISTSGTHYVFFRTVSNVGNVSGASNGELVKVNGSTYTITYDLAGGSLASGVTNPESYNVESSFTLNNPTRNGYSFAGWTGSNGTTKQTTVTVGINNSGNKSYTANWNPNTYTVKYNGNNSTGGSTSQHTCTYDAICSAANNGFSRTGYSFAGWKRENSGSTIQEGASIKNTVSSGEVTYYAQWTVNKYYFDLNGYLDGADSGGIEGYGTADVYINNKRVCNDCTDLYDQYDYGSTYEIKDIKTTTGHTYNGVHSGSLTGTIGANTVRTSLDFTTSKYYFDVNPDSHISTFDISINKGTTLTGQTDYYEQINYGSTAVITNVTPATGYHYTGYSISGNVSTQSGSSNSNIKLQLGAGNGAVALNSEANTFTVAYAGNNSTGGSTSQHTCIYDQNCTLANNGFTRTNYVFRAWRKENSGSDKAPGTNVKNVVSSGTVTYYAQWDRAYALVEDTGTYYKTVQDAINAVSMGTIKVIRDTTENINVPANKMIVINNEKTITGCITVQASGDLVLTGGGSIRCSNASGITNYGTITINNQKIYATGGIGIYLLGSSRFTMHNGLVQSSSNGIVASSTGFVTIYGGHFISTSASDTAVLLTTGYMWISGATVENTSGTGRNGLWNIGTGLIRSFNNDIANNSTINGKIFFIANDKGSTKFTAGYCPNDNSVSWVKFPTWSSAGETSTSADQDDLVWYESHDRVNHLGNSCFVKEIEFGNHNNDKNYYQVHVYPQDSSGHNYGSAYDISFPRQN